MMNKTNLSPNKKTTPTIVEFFGKYAAAPYLLKWLLISAIIGSLIGSASAGFLQSLDWVTNYREAHLWIISFLPLG